MCIVILLVYQMSYCMSLLDPDRMHVEISTEPRRRTKPTRVMVPVNLNLQETKAFMYKQTKPELKLCTY